MTSIEIIKRLYEAFAARDYDLFRSICDTNIEWIQNKGFPGGGHHHGAEAVIRYVFEKFEDDWDYFRFDIEDLFESLDGARVTVVGAYIGRHKRTGMKVEAAAAHVYDISHQKVKRFRQFTDTALIVAATQT